jgi:hypothetical protein
MTCPLLTRFTFIGDSQLIQIKEYVRAPIAKLGGTSPTPPPRFLLREKGMAPFGLTVGRNILMPHIFYLLPLCIHFSNLQFIFAFYYSFDKVG